MCTHTEKLLNGWDTNTFLTHLYLYSPVSFVVLFTIL